LDNWNEIREVCVEMSVNITEEVARKVIRAVNLRRRIRELEKQIGELQREKAKLEEEYENLGVKIE